jgi:hypothetical protein
MIGTSSPEDGKAQPDEERDRRRCLPLDLGQEGVVSLGCMQTGFQGPRGSWLGSNEVDECARVQCGGGGSHDECERK